MGEQRVKQSFGDEKESSRQNRSQQMRVEVRGHLVGVGLLLPCGSWESDSVGKACQLVPLPASPSFDTGFYSLCRLVHTAWSTEHVMSALRGRHCCLPQVLSKRRASGKVECPGTTGHSSRVVS